jgi:hypothetical protein
MADTLAQAGHREQAQLAAGEALEATRGIEHVRTRAEILGSMADTLANAHAGSAGQPCPVVYEARKAIDNIYDDKQRSNVYATLAKALARLRRYCPAREMADLSSVTEDRVMGYTAILHAYVLEHNPNLAQLVEAKGKNDLK